MPKQQRKYLSFQAGEISPRFFGRSDTELYDKGLAVAENVIIDKRGGVFKRHGLEHIGRVNANKARLFVLQVSRVRFYTIVIFFDLLLVKGQMLIFAPGAKIAGDNLLLNGSFVEGSLNWNTAVTPISSQVLFTGNQARLRPEQDNLQLVANGNFQQQELGWIVREVPAASSVSFAVGSVTLLPRNLNVGDLAGIAQELVTGSPGEVHTVTLTGNYSQQVSLRIGTIEADGSYLDTVITVQSNDDPISFTPAASPFFITIDCEFPDVVSTLSNVSVIEVVSKTAAVSQEATVTAAITDQHVVIVGQQGVERLHVLIGTTDGDNDIAEFDSADHEIVGEFVPNNATFWVTVLADGDQIEEARINFIGTAEEAVAGALGILMDAPWNEGELDEIHMIEAPSGKTLYFTHPNVPVQKLIYDHAADTFVPLAEVIFTEPPPQWDGINHPSTGAHFQGRLWLAGTPGEQQTVWGSVSGSDEDFTVEADSDASSIEFTLQDFGRIEWMLGTKTLLIGAENSEHLVTSDGGVIVPSDFSIQRQSSFGSNHMRGIQVGEKVFYMTSDGRKLRSMAYEWQEDNWLSEDLTYVSEQITIGIGKFSAWAQNPDSLFILVLEDGTLGQLTYDRTAEAVAWSHATMPGMDIKDVGSGRADGVNVAVLAGQRVPGTIDLETNSANTEYLDSYVSVFDAGGTNIITGLEHLEGETVTPLVDGAVNPPVVVTGGQITTQDTGVRLFAGIPYNSKMVTLPPDITDGSIRSWKKRWNKVWALMFESNAPIINGVRPPDRTPSTPMNTPEPTRSGHFKTVNLGWDDFGQITIEEDLPVPMNVLAIYGEMGVESVG